MSNTVIPANLQLCTEIAGRIRGRCARMVEHDADKVRLAMANGEDLTEGREKLTRHGSWLIWLREACELRQRQALNYVTLAEHKQEVEAYLQRAANMGTKPSIRGALDFISPPQAKPKKPKKLTEVETPETLGAFLEQHPELLFKALPHAPALTAEIVKRLERPLGRKAAKARAKAAKLPLVPLVARGDAASLH
jgi:hypothetical protein